MAIEDVLKNFDREIKQMSTAGEKAVYEVAADLLNKAVELCPISPLGTERKDGTKSGDLRKSGKNKMIRRGNRPTAQVSFGDGKVDYAAAVHEVQKGNYSEPGTGWKYLERPLKQNEKRYINYIRKEIGRKL